MTTTANTIDPEHLRVANTAVGDYLPFVNDADNPIPGDIYHRLNCMPAQHADGLECAKFNAMYCLGYVEAVRANNPRKPAIEAAWRAAQILNRLVMHASLYADRPIDSNM